MAESVAPPPGPAGPHNTPVAAYAPGGHQFLTSFGSGAIDAAQIVARPRKRRRGLLLSGIGFAVIALACAGTQLGANLAYDEARVAFEAVAEDADAQQTLLDGELLTLTETTSIASTITTAASGSLIDAALKEELAEIIADAETVTADATSLREQNLPRADDKPDWAWELFGETAQLNADRETAEHLSDEFASASSAASEAAVAVEESGSTVVSTAADAAESFEAAHVSARNLDIIALRKAAEQIHTSEALDETSASAFVALETAAEQMRASEKAELAEKSGPLRDARVEIEAFARSIAPDVLLDFDWSERVNGYGYGDSMGGYATWWYSDPGYATIELSNSVAANWPSDRSKALVVHEVGHTMSVKCQDMYDDSTQENIEAWATAWAISMGYHNDANGTWAYGAPPQSLIDTAAKCR